MYFGYLVIIRITSHPLHNEIDPVLTYYKKNNLGKWPPLVTFILEYTLVAVDLEANLLPSSAIKQFGLKSFARTVAVIYPFKITSSTH